MKEAKYKVGDKVIVKTEYDIDPNTGKRYNGSDYLYAFLEHMLENSANIIWNIKTVFPPNPERKKMYPSKKIYGDCAKYILQGSDYSYHSGMFENGR
jgi:hypothetical protein